LDNDNHILLRHTTRQAAVRGLIYVVYYLLNQANSISRSTFNLVFMASIIGASKDNQIELLNILITKAIDMGRDINWILANIMAGASEGGNTNLLEWVWENGGMNLNLFYPIIGAIQAKQTRGLEFFRSKGINIETILKAEVDKHPRVSYINYLRKYLTISQIQFLNDYLMSINKE